MDYFKTHKNICVFLDYDGTLSEIQKLPELAVLAPHMKEILNNLKEKYIVGIISGRELENVRKLVNVDGLIYSGNHGIEIQGEDIDFIHEEAQRNIKLLKDLERILQKNLQEYNVLIENKRFSLSLHYRNVEESQEKIIKDIFNNIFENKEFNFEERFEVFEGKKVTEARPKINWHKGKAIEKIFNILKKKYDSLGVIFIGDDTTDEDGFKVVNELGGLSFRVGDLQKHTNAKFRLDDIDAVRKFLSNLLLMSGERFLAKPKTALR